MPPDLQRMRSAAEVVDVLKRRLHGYMEGAAQAVDAPRPRSVVAYARYLLQIRGKLRSVAQMLHGKPEVHERLFRQAEIAYFTRPDRFTDVEGREQLLEAWTSLLLEAAEKVAADERRAQRYAEIAPHNSGDDRSAVTTASRLVVQRWHDE